MVFAADETVFWHESELETKTKFKKLIVYTKYVKKDGHQKEERAQSNIVLIKRCYKEALKVGSFFSVTSLLKELENFF